LKKLLIFTILICALTFSAWAEGGIGGKAGQFYLGLNSFTGGVLGDIGIGFQPSGFEYANYTDASGSSENIIALNLDFVFGYFIMDGLELGFDCLGLFLNNSSGSNWNSSYIMGPGIEATYIFNPGGNIAPYVKLSGNFMLMNSTSSSNPDLGPWTTGFMVMPSIGGKVFFTPNVSFDVAGFYHYARMTTNSDWFSFSSFGLTFGVSAYF
jgi:hypothetical protein